MSDLLLRRHEYIGWLRNFGVIWFRVKADYFEEKSLHLQLLVPAWRSDNQAQAARGVFEDPFALQKAVLHDTSWWAHIEYVTEAAAPVLLVRYDQIGWAVEQPWIADRMKET